MPAVTPRSAIISRHRCCGETMLRLPRCLQTNQHQGTKETLNKAVIIDELESTIPRSGGLLSSPVAAADQHGPDCILASKLPTACSLCRGCSRSFIEKHFHDWGWYPAFVHVLRVDPDR